MLQRLEPSCVLILSPCLKALRIAQIPAFFSSLYPSNLQQCHSVENLAEARLKPAWPLLFDPQTSGGLLASVSSEKSVIVLKELHEAGYAKATVIGHVTEPSDRPEKLVVV
mmetsp:Transcript_2335/g.15618  ORF Transcript_2335/g.15618 Transcript_2335/m.15618 type:complete len:111 (+) Transcript_2335:6910-7242(+)